MDLDLPGASAAMDLPEALPTLGRSTDPPSDHRFSAMEAASWVAGERLSNRPRSVHPVLARVALATNDGLEDDERQQLWTLILASLDTARPRRLRLRWHLSRLARGLDHNGGREMSDLWALLIAEHERWTANDSVPRPHQLLHRSVLGAVSRLGPVRNGYPDKVGTTLRTPFWT